MGLEKVGQERKLTEILADQLKREGIPPSTALGQLAQRIRGVQEIESLDPAEPTPRGSDPTDAELSQALLLAAKRLARPAD